MSKENGTSKIELSESDILPSQINDISSEGEGEYIESERYHLKAPDIYLRRWIVDVNYQ